MSLVPGHGGPAAAASHAGLGPDDPSPGPGQSGHGDCTQGHNTLPVTKILKRHARRVGELESDWPGPGGPTRPRASESAARTPELSSTEIPPENPVLHTLRAHTSIVMIDRWLQAD